MNEIQKFNFNGMAVRVKADANNEPWFVAKDVAEILGYRDAFNLCRRLDDDEKGTQKVSTHGAEQDMTVINESGLYNAILGSSKPDAKAFKRWVTGEVLPTIRKIGGYMVATANDTPQTIMARAVLIAQDTIRRQEEELAAANRELEKAAPKVAFVETFTNSFGNILVRDYAKQISQSLNLRGFGQREMFDWLRNNGYMNLNRYPSQKAVDSGLLHVTEGIHTLNSGITETHHTTRITAKGQTHFFELIRKQYETSGRWW